MEACFSGMGQQAMPQRQGRGEQACRLPLGTTGEAFGGLPLSIGTWGLSMGQGSTSHAPLTRVNRARKQMGHVTPGDTFVWKGCVSSFHCIGFNCGCAFATHFLQQQNLEEAVSELQMNGPHFPRGVMQAFLTAGILQYQPVI